MHASRTKEGPLLLTNPVEERAVDGAALTADNAAQRRDAAESPFIEVATLQ